MKTLNAGTIFSIIFISSWACVYVSLSFSFLFNLMIFFKEFPRF